MIVLPKSDSVLRPYDDDSAGRAVSFVTTVDVVGCGQFLGIQITANASGEVIS